MIYHIVLILLLFSSIPSILQYLITVDNPDGARITAALISGFLLSAISVTGVLITGKKFWRENDFRGRNLLFLQATIVGALFPFLDLILIYLLGGFSQMVVMVP